MIQDKIKSGLINEVCEAINCSAKVTTTILVKAGNRNVVLNLCNSCISKFEDSIAEQHPNKELRSEEEEEEDELCSDYSIVKRKDKVNTYERNVILRGHRITPPVKRLSYLEKVET